jgi:acetyltransferase-like isoleucine patch superfamily enzyme
MLVRVLRKIFRQLRRAKKAIFRQYYTFCVRYSAQECGPGLRVNGYTAVNDRTFLDHHVRTNGLLIRGGGRVTIGAYFHSGSGCVMMTSTHNFDGGSRLPYGPGTEDIYKDILIGPFVWLGNNVTVLGGVEIGEGAVIQAGSTVVSDIPPLAIAGGHPAKVFKYRDKAHYEELKQKGLFH